MGIYRSMSELLVMEENLKFAQEDGAQGLHHHAGELEVLFHHQQLRHAPVDVLAAEQHAQLPDNERALALQEVFVRAEKLQQREHKLLEVRGRDLAAVTDF